MRTGITFTLVFIKNDYQILLGLKKRGFGKDKWNGFGGKVEKNESIFEGAIRETKEECNLKLEKLNYIGVVAYEEKFYSKIDFVHIFTANKYSDVLQETEEMKPQWFDIKDIPYQQMWPDGKEWYPFMLKEKYFLAHVIYDNQEKYKSCQIEECGSINLVLESLKSLTKLKNLIP